jgi:superfamily II DNA or RNA helicase
LAQAKGSPLLQLVFEPNASLPADGRLLFYRVGQRRPPMADVAALGLPADVRSVPLALPVEGEGERQRAGGWGSEGEGERQRAGVRIRAHPVVAVPLRAALGVLVRGGDRRQPNSPTIQTYARAAGLATGLVAEHQIAPVLRQIDDRVVSQWRALLPAGGTAADTLTALADALPAAGHALPRDATTVWHPYALLRAFVDAVVDVLAREPDAATTSTGRPRARLLPWTARWQEAAVDAVDPTVPLGAERGEIVAGVGEWLRPFERVATEHTAELSLVAPAGPAQPWTLKFGLRDRDGRRIGADDLWSHAGGDRNHVEALLEALARAARVFAPIEDALDHRQPTHAVFATDVAWQFMDQVVPLLRDAGYHVALPDDMDELRPRIQLGTATADADAPSDQVELTWQAAVGDAVVDEATVDELMAASGPLVYWDDRWIRIARETRTQWQERSRGVQRIPLTEALGLAVAGVATGLGRIQASEATQVVAVGPLGRLVDRLRHASTPEPVNVPPGFRGQLRPYQLDAVGWLGMMADLELGGVLADDMGLGKTVMLIAHLLQQGCGPHLVVCPTSVVANWERELTRFAPGLPKLRHHGADRGDDLDGFRGVVVTSYGTLRRDIDMLAQVRWHVVALDEAQQVKNPDTLGARAVRRLRSWHCVALTGTPVENRLRELWSVLDLTNSGLLGPRVRFERRYANPIERRGDHAARVQLRRMIAPFVLRRTKADPRVASDLPPRIERTVPCILTDEQRQRYSDTVEAFRRGQGERQRAGGRGFGGEGERQRAGGRGFGGEGVRQRAGGRGTIRQGEHRTSMQYRGAVLALLTRLKQICDHPGLGIGGGRLADGHSGKLAVTRQLITEATQAGEQVLVFTQFVGMAELLARDLSRLLQTDLPVLHGGLSTAARQRIVDRFQGQTDEMAPPVLIASLRAGGIGMNLTAATQVIHYDRWWNPAVEDQASDRAHRIGQTERVLIHRLVTIGTLEEHIDAMLASKREIADAVVGPGETWITELDVDQLLELVELSDASEAAAADLLVAGGRR